MIVMQRYYAKKLFSMNASLSKLLQNIITWIFVFLFSVTPLFFLTVNEELFEFNKMILVYGCATLILTSWLIKMVIDKRLIWRRTPLDIPILLFLGSQLLSTIFSLHPRTSFFGYYTRFHGGLLSTLTYIALYYAYVSNFTNAMQRKVLLALLASGVLVSLYAIPEHFGISPSCVFISQSLSTSCWVQDVQTRVFATFGQPNWLAAYMIMLIPLGMVEILRQQHRQLMSARSLTRSSTRLPQSWQRYVVPVAMVFLGYLTLLFTKSRSGFLGLVMGLSVMVALLFLNTVRKSQPVEHLAATLRSLFIVLSCVLVFGGLAGIFGTPFTPSLAQMMGKQEDQVVTVEPVVTNRLEEGGSDSGEIRKIVWQGAIDVWKRSPIVGSGVETFAYSYYLDRPMAHNTVSEWDFLYNKAHNEFLNFLATSGILGLASYSILQLASLVLCTWYAARSIQVETRLLAVGAMAALVGLHVSNFFGFSTVMVSVIQYLLPAMVLISGSQDAPVAVAGVAEKSAIKPRAMNTGNGASTLSPMQYFSIGCIVLVGTGLIIQISMIWSADRLLARSRKWEAGGDYNQALKTIDTAILLSPQEAIYYEQKGRLAAQLAIALAQADRLEEASEVASTALDASAKSIMLNPAHLNFYRSRTNTLLTLAQAQPDLFQEALRTLQVAEQLAPTDPKLVFNHGVIESIVGNQAAAITSLEKAVEMKPNYESARYQLGLIYEEIGKPEQAAEQYEYIITNISTDNPVVIEALARVATSSGTTDTSSTE